MPTERGPALLAFAPIEGRQWSRASTAAPSPRMPARCCPARRIGLVQRFAACFRDARTPERVEHEVANRGGERVS